MRTAAEIAENLARLNTRLDHVADGLPEDRAAGRLKPSALKQAGRRTDAALRRNVELRREISAEESALASARGRERNAALAARAVEAAWTPEKVRGATHVWWWRTGWETVARVNKTTVSCVVPDGWNPVRVPYSEIVAVRGLASTLPAPTGGEER